MHAWHGLASNAHTPPTAGQAPRAALWVILTRPLPFPLQTGKLRNASLGPTLSHIYRSGKAPPLDSPLYTTRQLRKAPVHACLSRPRPASSHLGAHCCADDLLPCPRSCPPAEGLPGLFRGNGASVLRIVPYAAVHYWAYEHYRRLLVSAGALGAQVGGVAGPAGPVQHGLRVFPAWPAASRTLPACLPARACLRLPAALSSTIKHQGRCSQQGSPC